MKKKILAALTAGILTTGLMTGGVFAADTEVKGDENLKGEVYAFIAASLSNSMEEIQKDFNELYQKGIFPAAVDLTTDLHSMGQFIQDGARIMFETVLEVAESPAEIILKKEDVDTDGMNYLAGKSVDFVNKSAMNGTILAHTDGSVPNLKVTIPAMDAYSLGQLFYFL